MPFCLNCTFMELKSCNAYVMAFDKDSLNCTFMELKSPSAQANILFVVS